MSQFNNLTIVGRLTRDPELRTTTGGKSVCEFSVAVNNSRGGDNGTTSFFRCTAWEGLADTVANYCHKGKLVLVNGPIQSRKYTASDGAEKEVWEVKARDVQFLDGAKSASDDERATRPRDPDPDEYDPFAED